MLKINLSMQQTFVQLLEFQEPDWLRPKFRISEVQNQSQVERSEYLT